MKELIFVRHAQSIANATHMIALDDSPLSTLGEAQARSTGNKLRQEFGSADFIFSSPATRAQQTAAIIADCLSYPKSRIVHEPLLLERDFGPLCGKEKQHESLWYFDNEYPEVESREALLVRMQKLYETAKLLPYPTSVAVGHAVAGFFLLQISKGHTSIHDFDPSFQLDNAEYISITL